MKPLVFFAVHCRWKLTNRVVCELFNSSCNFIMLLLSISLPLLFLTLSPSLSEAASFFPEKAKPLSEVDIKNLEGGDVAGDKLFSGDLIFYVDHLRLAGFSRQLWPNGTMIIDFDAQLDQAKRDAVFNACNAWAQVAPVRCQTRTNEVLYVFVAEHNGTDPSRCGAMENVSCSAVGRQIHKQDLFVYLTHWNNQRVLQHELAHAFGMVHEQSRRDRDQFVTISWDNVDPKATYNFGVEPADSFSDYDYNSIMHYRNCDFSIHKLLCSPTTPQYQTIVPKACNLDVVGGAAITALDAEGMRRAYMPNVMGLYDEDRSPACGILKLSPTQKEYVCGANCGSVGALEYLKQEIRRGDGQCGFAVPNYPIEKYKGYCETPPPKDYIEHRWDSREFQCTTDSIPPLPATLHDLYVKCGCAQQTVNAKCTEFSKGTNLAKVERLIERGDLRDQAMGRFVRQLITWKQAGKLDGRISDKLPSFLMKNYLQQSFPGNLREMNVLTQIYVMWKSTFDKNFVLSLENFRDLAWLAAFDTNGM